MKLKKKQLLVFLSILILVRCKKDDPIDDTPMIDVITVEGVVAASDTAPDGNPSLADLTTIGLINLTEAQDVYESAIASASPSPTSLSDLQTIIDMTNEEIAAISEKYFGVNLAGAEFGFPNFPGTYNTDYTYPTSEEFDYYKTKGLNLIRMPFSWERIQTTLNGELNTAELDRIKAVLQIAADRKMKVLLDMHNYGRYTLNGTEEIIGSNNLSIANARDVWTKLAAELNGSQGVWGYGIMNEPHDLLETTPWFAIAQELINGIRSEDPNTRILVAGDSWSSAALWPEFSDNLKDLVDPSNKLIFEAHVYFDNDFSGRYDQNYDTEGAYDTIGVDRVQPFVNWLQTNNLKGFVGEYGIPGNDERWLTALDNMLAYLSTNCVNGTYWAGGPWWGDYILTIEPNNGVDQPQMDIVQKYPSANGDCL